MERRRGNNNGMAAIVVTLTALIVVAVWWMESRFGTAMTGYALVGLFGVICLVIGYILSLASTRSTLNSAAEFNRDLAGVEKYRQQAFREFARGDSHERRAAAQITVLDARRVDQLATQRAKMLVDTEREKWALQRARDETLRNVPKWALDDDDGEFSEWE